jgi:hypothetical protein
MERLPLHALICAQLYFEQAFVAQLKRNESFKYSRGASKKSRRAQREGVK